MHKENIREIVTETVTVEEAKVVEMHKPLDGKQAMEGSPQGSEAQPKSNRSGWKGY